MNAPIVIADCETTGLGEHDQIWEFAAIRIDPATGATEEYECFVQHDTRLAESLPEPFASDYASRYDEGEALSPGQFTGFLRGVFRQNGTQRAHVLGAVPSFDTNHLTRKLKPHGVEPLWHYHLTDIENVAIGYLRGEEKGGESIGDARTYSDPRRWLPPHDSDDISMALGVDPTKFARHTAMGDCRWIKAQWDVIFGG